MIVPFSHETVLLNEAVEAVYSGEGVYVDGTYGRGGHARLLLSRLGSKSKLIVVDKDPQAIEHAQQWALTDARIQVVHAGFAQLGQLLKELGISDSIRGILLDLGVSSPQLDEATRGFSFQSEGPLDMRMNPTAGISAQEWLASVEESALADVLYQYGDERFSRRIAKAIVVARQQSPITTTAQLADIIKVAHPKWDHRRHPATKSFQAIRIFINQELNELTQLLSQVPTLLTTEGRLAVISFHSLEDRIVKQFIRRQSKGPDVPKGLPILESQLGKTMLPVGKAIKPTEAEIQANVRSRSAVLRVASRL